MSFLFPTRRLENSRLSLVPYDPGQHHSLLLSSVSAHPSLYEFLPYGPFTDLEEIEQWYHGRFETNAASFLFAIFAKDSVSTKKEEDDDDDDDGESVKVKSDGVVVVVAEERKEGKGDESGQFAGVVGLLSATAQNAAVEIGHIVILPAYQRTYVTTHAVGLLLHFLLDMSPPATSSTSTSTSTSTSASDNNNNINNNNNNNNNNFNLGLRRVEWQANASNHKSIRAATRLGYTFEGIMRWQRVLGEGKRGFFRGEGGGEGEEKKKKSVDGRGPGRHSALLSLCWDDWEEGGKREAVGKLMER